MKAMEINGAQYEIEVDLHDIQPGKDLHLAPRDFRPHLQFAGSSSEVFLQNLCGDHAATLEPCLLDEIESRRLLLGASWSSVYTSMLLSKKLRTPMQLLTVEAPPS